jgi:protein-S-isoprenylcysteine O-methyltransferase Ste14
VWGPLSETLVTWLLLSPAQASLDALPALAAVKGLVAESAAISLMQAWRAFVQRGLAAATLDNAAILHPATVTKTHILLTLLGVTSVGMMIRRYPPVWNPMQIAGLCILLVGFVLWTVARFQLASSFSITAQAQRLVTRGIYSKIRNPIYIFGSTVTVGLFLLIGKPQWLWVFAVLIPVQIARARREAQVLEEKFGDDYRTYRAGTWF